MEAQREGNTRMVNEAEGQVKSMIAAVLGRYSNTVSAADADFDQKRMLAEATLTEGTSGLARLYSATWGVSRAKCSASKKWICSYSSAYPRRLANKASRVRGSACVFRSPMRTKTPRFFAK